MRRFNSGPRLQFFSRPEIRPARRVRRLTTVEKNDGGERPACLSPRVKPPRETTCALHRIPDSARLEARTVAFSGSNEVLGALALVLALLAAQSGLVGGAQATSLLPFAVAFFLAYRPLRELAEARIAWSRALAASEELALENPATERPRVALAKSEAPRAWTLAPIALRRLVLANGTRKELTLTIEPGSIVAIVGANGSGKTTLLRTLLGLEEARSGSIQYGAHKLDHAGVGPDERPFAWVPQDAPLLADTLEANVGLADHGRTNEAITTMQLGALATTLGDARLGAGGRAVSGGERRAIAIDGRSGNFHGRERTTDLRAEMLERRPAVGEILDRRQPNVGRGRSLRFPGILAVLQRSQSVIFRTLAHRQRLLAHFDGVLAEIDQALHPLQTFSRHRRSLEEPREHVERVLGQLQPFTISRSMPSDASRPTRSSRP